MNFEDNNSTAILKTISMKNTKTLPMTNNGRQDDDSERLILSQEIEC